MMAGAQSPPPPTSALPRRPSPADLNIASTSRRRSDLSVSSSTTSRSSMSPPTSPSGSTPRVQLVPHVHRLSYDSSLSQSEREVLDNTNFDALDLSSKDFDFEEIFTYDKPQRKLASVVEVSSPSRDKDWSNFTFSHYNSAAAIRQKVSRNRGGIGEMYVRNKSDSQKR